MSLTNIVLSELEKVQRGEESKFIQRKFEDNTSSLVWYLGEKDNPKRLKDIGWRIYFVSVYGSCNISTQISVHLATLLPLRDASISFTIGVDTLKALKDIGNDGLVVGCSRQISSFYSQQLELAFSELCDYD